MKNIDQIQHEVDKTFNSLNGIGRAQVSPYFYSRLVNRIAQKQEAKQAGWLQWFSRPAISISVLTVFVVLNVMAIRGMVLKQNTTAQASAAQNIASEFNLNTASVYAN